MGMFDYIKINLDKLPITEKERKLLEGKDFQTKDLDKTLSEYRITDDGFLEQYHWEWEQIPEHEIQPLPKQTPKKKKSVFELSNELNRDRRKKEIGWEKVEDVHKDIFFYTSLTPHSSKSHGWIEFKAHFNWIVLFVLSKMIIYFE
jgi:hypothetical protein